MSLVSLLYAASGRRALSDAWVEGAPSELTKTLAHLADTCVATCITPQWVPRRRDLPGDCGFRRWMASRPKRLLALLLLVPLALSAFRGKRGDTPSLLFIARFIRDTPPSCRYTVKYLSELPGFC